MLNFLGIGAQKAGTTWLYEQLRRHPQLAFPMGKEVHFWDAYYDRGLEWYLPPFQGNEKIKGEITPAYAILPVHLIREIYQVNPKMRLIYLVRNPIDRAWSSARMALKRAEMTIEEASDQWFIDHFHSYGSMARGDYQQCLTNWLKVFPKNQFLVLKFEDIRHNPLALLERCCQHLGCDPSFFRSVPSQELQQKIHEGQGAPLRPGLRLVLETVYGEKMARFEQFLNEWNQVSAGR